MADAKVESPEKRIKRYTKAKGVSDLWNGILEDAYSFVLPYKNDFYTRTKGEQRNEEIFDATGYSALQNFANNIQSVLMPPYQQWAVLEAGPEVQKAATKAENARLQIITDTLFRFLDESNFILAINESLQEFGVSTGIITVNDGGDDSPLEFISMPLSSVSFEEGRFGRLSNFWREWKLSLEQVMKNWPGAKLPEEKKRLLKDSPQTMVTLIEGTIEYPENPEGQKILWYLQLQDTKKDILTEWRDFNPWIGFRFSKAPNEAYGRGPALMAMPFIKTASKMVEFNLRAAKFKAWPSYMASDTGLINPYNMVLEPGAIVPVEPNFMINPPIQQIPNGGDIQFAELNLQDTRTAIKEIMFANPLPLSPTPNVTATQISLMQNEWVRRNASAFSRLTVELLRPVIDKSLMILRKRGLIDDIKIDGKAIGLRYESPLIRIQAEKDVATVREWISLLTQELGPTGLIGTNVHQLPEWYAQKLGVDLSLVKNAGETQKAFEDFVTKIQQQQQAQPEVPAETAPLV